MHHKGAKGRFGGFLGAVVSAIAWLAVASSAHAAEMTVYKSPWCGCCAAWVEHVRENGFTVSVVELEDLDPVKRHHHIPGNLQSCHTAEIDGYVIEGHVPAVDIRRLLKERPKARGLAVPGMPVGSPGMEQGNRKDRYPVVLFGDGDPELYAIHE